MDFRDLYGTADSKDKKVVKRWWTTDEKDLPDAIAGLVAFLADNQSRRYMQQAVSAKLYGNVTLAGAGASALLKAKGQSTLRDRISYNVVQSVVDTVTSKMAKNKPKPLFLTDRGNWRQKRQAQKLTAFVDGVFHENKAHDLGTMIFRDAAVLDTGCVHVFVRDGRVTMERVLSSEILVDEVEALYGQPRSMHRVKPIDRDVLAEAFPDHAVYIKEEAKQIKTVDASSSASDMVEVRESWHLPSGPDAKDGVHSITIDGKTLMLDKKWEGQRFPFAFLPWASRLSGFWGQSLAEQIQNIQLEINKILWVIQRSYHMAGSFKVLIENGSKIVSEHLNNDIGAQVHYTGTMPQYVTPPVIPPEMYAHLQTLKASAFEQAGISQLSASSKKPEGLDSGKALREFNDIESERFLTVGRAYERFFLDLGQLVIDAAEEAAGDGDYMVRVPEKGGVEEINWRDVRMDQDSYVMKMFPVSSLPSDPEGRLQTIVEYAQAGYISPRTARRLLDFPDLEAVEDLANAGEDYLHKIFDRMYEEGEYTPPEPFDNIPMAREMALEYYAQGKLQGVEEERLDLVRKFLSQLDGLEMAMTPPMDPGLAPQGVPEPAPVNPLIPNVPGQPPVAA